MSAAAADAFAARRDAVFPQKIQQNEAAHRRADDVVFQFTLRSAVGIVIIIIRW